MANKLAEANHLLESRTESFGQSLTAVQGNLKPVLETLVRKGANRRHQQGGINNKSPKSSVAGATVTSAPGAARRTGAAAAGGMSSSSPRGEKEAVRKVFDALSRS